MATREHPDPHYIVRIMLVRVLTSLLMKLLEDIYWATKITMGSLFTKVPAEDHG